MIRPYQDSDLETVLDIWYQASLVATPFLNQEFLAQERKNIQEIYIPNTLTWVFEKEHGAKGFISMIGNEVGAIFVYPDFQGQGIGRSLMDKVSGMHPVLEVEVFEKNASGRSFYDRYGFQSLQQHLHEPTNEQMLRMRYSVSTD